MKATTPFLRASNFVLTSNPFTLEAASPAPHNSLASNSKFNTNGTNAFKTLNFSTCFSNFDWNFAFNNLTSLRALIIDVKIYLKYVVN